MPLNDRASGCDAHRPDHQAHNQPRDGADQQDERQSAEDKGRLHEAERLL
jgi:hypothetical protein